MGQIRRKHKGKAKWELDSLPYPLLDRGGEGSRLEAGEIRRRHGEGGRRKRPTFKIEHPIMERMKDKCRRMKCLEPPHPGPLPRGGERDLQLEG
jgi:hypothetical protein